MNTGGNENRNTDTILTLVMLAGGLIYIEGIEWMTGMVLHRR